MTTDDIYEKWTISIDLKSTRIARNPSFVFLCGGPVSTNNGHFKSCRDFFYSHIKTSKRRYRDKVLLAEEVFNYFKHSAYKDLVCFERDLAELSALTVIFSESPGSIAELGSFAVLKPVQEKLFIVIHEDDAEKESFIWRGPVLHVNEVAKAQGKNNPVSVYNWRKALKDDDILTEEDFPDAEELEDAIEEFLSSLPKTQAFRKEQVGHVMLLMLDLLNVILLATADEIITCLKLLGINLKHPEVDQRLSLLTSLKLVVKKPYGHNVYYLTAHNRPWLNWGYAKSATVRDVERWKLQFAEHYSKNIPRKMKAWKSYLKATA